MTLKSNLTNEGTRAISPRRISIMGSTGSIGCQTLDIISHYPEYFQPVALTANNNWEKLARQAIEFNPRMVVIANKEFYTPLAEALKGKNIEVLAGQEGLDIAATLPETDIVVGALVGYSGLPSTVKALEAGKTVALANKETLVVGGQLIEKIVDRKGKPILPVDSEHSAIFQCLWGERKDTVKKLILTASGGPFRNFSLQEMEKVTVAQALAHPNWDMGAKVTIDSATMMNKGFEMIEARWLFRMPPSSIDVLVHPESIVHSMVEFIDGSVKAQMGVPDMRIPIEVALSYPGRLDLLSRLDSSPLNLAQAGSLSFFKPDFERFPLLSLAYRAAEAGGLVPALMNAANEVAVKAFLEGNLGFTNISCLVINTVDALQHHFEHEEVTLDNIAAAHLEGTKFALNLLR